MSLTEDALLERTTELAHVQAEAAKAKLAEDGAYALAASARGREEELKIRERELQMKLREAGEEVRMSDLAVTEYADLVRVLEGRAPKSPPPKSSPPSSASSMSTLVDGLSEGRAGLHKLFGEFSVESERLQGEVARLHDELDVLRAKFDAEKKVSAHDRVERAKAQVELEKLRLDDSTAAKMVSRYMYVSASPLLSSDYIPFHHITLTDICTL